MSHPYDSSRARNPVTPNTRWRLAAALLAACALAGASEPAAQAPRPAVSVTGGPDGRLVYTADQAGSRIIDFSHAGYGGGGVELPAVPARVLVPAGGGRDGQRVQAALDLVAAMPAGTDGFRGAVLLEAGTYNIDTSLRIGASGVVLRGSGASPDGTVLVAAGTSRRALVSLGGSGERREIAGSERAITDEYVPVGALSFTVDRAIGFSVGSRVVVRRPSTKAWIALLGMDLFQGWRPENRLHWQPGSRDIEWDRTITAIDGARITVDAPLSTAIEAAFGGGSVAPYAFPGRICRSGVENLRLVSAHDAARPMDEDHSWTAVAIDAIEDAWVRHVTVAHFAGSAIDVGPGALRVTVEDVEALDPISEPGGYRRRVFQTEGQLTLFRRCRSERGLHDFAAGFNAAGPNVILESSAREALGFSGPLGSWASGILYDNVIIRGNAIRLTNRGLADQGAGWAAANSIVWNSEATDIEVQSPPGAVNQAYGCKGMVTGDGTVWDPRTMPYRDFYRGSPVQPRSLYLAQLAERLGQAAVDATRPAPISTASGGARRLSESDVDAYVARQQAQAATAERHPLRVDDGAFTIDGQRAWTARVNWSWYQGQMPRSLAKPFGPAITRFAPGRIGTGATDDLEEVAAGMAPRSAFYHHYGLWYDRRRVDHNYYGSPEQRTSEVWAPFMELPWARSGIGKAWDGLSRYDLTRFNPWFFERIRDFAGICDRQGLILYHNFYFQHWLLESRSHYVDFPWRPANAIQETGLPDEVPAANAFYDVSSPARRDLHRRYIRHALDNLADGTNVVHGIDREYTGPIEFVRFWLDTIGEWQKERGRQVFIALEIPKDQMDAILEDPVRGSMVSAIDVLGWVYRSDGRLFAVRGAINRAPREQRPDIASPAELDALKAKLGIAPTDQRDFLNGPEFQQLFNTLWAGSKPMRYRAWREYRDRYPRLVTLWDGDEYPDLTRAIERAIPQAVREGMRPAGVVRSPAGSAWCMAGRDAFLVYSMNGESVDLDLAAAAGRYAVSWLGPSGALQETAAAITGGRVMTLAPPQAGTGQPWVALLTRVRGQIRRSADSTRRSADLTPKGGRMATSIEWVLDNLTSIGGHAVSVVGAPRVVQTPIGPAVEFDGSSDGVFVDASPIEGLKAFTVEVLFEPAGDGPEEQRFLHVSETGSENRLLFETRTLPGGSWCLDTFLRHSDLSRTLIDRHLAHPAGNWHVVALAYDGTTMTHYVDGVRELSGDVAFPPLGAGRTSIGVRQNLISWFKGRIRLVRVTPVALPAARLLTVAARGGN